MSDLALVMKVDANNPNVGDLRLDNGTVRLTATLLESVAQRIMVSLKLFKGEWFLDETQGIPYWQNILGQKTPLTQVSRIFRNAVQNQPGVKSVTRFNSVRLPNRKVEIQFACLLDDGAVFVSSDYQPFIVGA